MDTVVLLLSVVFIAVGLIIMVRHRFYKYDMGSVFFATKIKVFTGGLIFFLMGSYALVSELSKLFK
jgi:hypothetical protein